MIDSHGRFVWYELMTTDMEAATGFYTKVVGWGTQDVSMPGMAYTLFTVAGSSVSGLMSLPEDAKKLGEKPSWIGYVGVDDVDAAANQIERLGGAVYVPPQNILDISRFSVVADPQMATLALVQWLKPRREQPAEPSAPGRIRWHELFAADWEKVFAFYGDLFGWQKENPDSRRDGRISVVLRRRTDDRRHVHEAADGAGPVLALLLQRRQHRRGGEAREGWWRPDPRGPA